MKQIIAITVSTKYDDLLDIIIPQNNNYFFKWIIITDKNDSATINIINKYNYDNIITLFYNFYEQGKVFNKGGAVKYGQEYVIKTFLSDYNILLLDSDIYLPEAFDEIMLRIDVKHNTLYGPALRNDYYSKKTFLQKTPDQSWNENSNSISGYFQLYNKSSVSYYNNSIDCSTCDLEFSRLFRNIIHIPSLTVSHLGKNCVNWWGRNTIDFL